MIILKRSCHLEEVLLNKKIVNSVPATCPPCGEHNAHQNIHVLEIHIFLEILSVWAPTLNLTPVCAFGTAQCSPMLSSDFRQKK